MYQTFELLFLQFHVTIYIDCILNQTITLNQNVLHRPTYLDEVLFYHYNWTFLQCSSLHHNTIGYIPVELFDSSRRLFALPNNVFNNNDNNNIFMLNTENYDT